MADPSLYYDFGADVLPWAAGTATDSIPDTGRDVLLALFKAALNAELNQTSANGDAWTNAVTGTPLAGTLPVQDELAMMPDADLVLQRKCAWPLLCVYRDGEPWAVEEFSLGRAKLTTRMHVDWILGPLDIASRYKLTSFMQRAAKVITLTCWEGGHPQYRASADGRALYVLGDNGAGFKECWPVKIEQGVARFATGKQDAATYLALSATLECEELSYFPDTSAGVLDGASLSVGGGSGEGIIPDLIQADTAQVQQSPLGIPGPE